MSAPTPEIEAPAAPDRPKHGSAVRWALTCAVATGSAWILALTGGFGLLNLSARPTGLGNPFVMSLFAGGMAATIGLISGLAVGLLRGGEQRFAWAAGLGLIGALGGAVGGGLGVPAVILFGDTLHPILSSALAWALAGLVAGLVGHRWSRWLHPPEPIDDEHDTPGRRVEWLLRQDEQRLRDRPLFRVLPVLTASALALVGAAAVAPSLHALSLAAAGVLGSAVALVLSAQERRQRESDARLRALERRNRRTPEEEAFAP